MEIRDCSCFVDDVIERLDQALLGAKEFSGRVRCAGDRALTRSAKDEFLRAALSTKPNAPEPI